MAEFPGSGSNIAKLLAEKTQNLRELACINEMSEITGMGKGISLTLDKIVGLIPLSMDEPGKFGASIVYKHKEYRSGNFEPGEYSIRDSFRTIDDSQGRITLYNLKHPLKQKVFSHSDRRFLHSVASLISEYLNSYTAREAVTPGEPGAPPEMSTQQLLQKFLERHNRERNLFHELQPFKVKEVLLVANLYDAYIIEGEGRFSDHILGEYHQMNLTVVPRVTAVSSESEALIRLQKKHFDIIIIMVGVDKQTPVKIASRISEAYPYLPVYLLANNNRDLSQFKAANRIEELPSNLFVWNGDSKVFFAMLKLLEDLVNVDNDTRLGVSRVILLVEDNPVYYSKYLSILYALVLEQTKELIEDVSKDDLYKVLKLRARPKILHARSYEEAVDIISNLGDYLLCVISDIRFPRGGRLSETAGFELINHVRTVNENLPVLMQSSDPQNERKAEEEGLSFIDKNSESLLQDLRSFIKIHLGFGHFVYRDKEGREIARARSMEEFEQYLRRVPDESLSYHAMKNQFSMWLMARGEFELARFIYPLKVHDFKSIDELREVLLELMKERARDMDRGKVLRFNQTALEDESNIVSMASGSLGGKGRGLAFVNTLIYNFNFSSLVEDIQIRTPNTVIIGTDEYDIYMNENGMYPKLQGVEDEKKIQGLFLASHLSRDLREKLKLFLETIKAPIAVRSSSLLEDSINQPFSGIFSTFLLPNNSPDFSIRMSMLEEAIKLVYSSIYSRNAKIYFEAVNFKAEDEKMAIVLQEVVGRRHESYFYPHISGTAQSHNYYPYAHMKPEEGFALGALGLGHYVVEGDKAYRFSPSYPTLEINTPKYLLRNSQTWFYALDMERDDPGLQEGELSNLVKLDLDRAEKHGTIKHLASVYSRDNDRLEPGIDRPGPRILNFANILKYKHIPLARTISVLLDVVKEAFGSPVEIEYAVDLSPDPGGKASFYILQVKPLLGAEASYMVDIDGIKKEDIVLYAEKSMGNGRVQDIKDIIYIKPEKFDRIRTEEMALEIEKMNAKMMKQGRKYVLIGPGRWGTRDRFIGIPVAWTQICNAAAIVEMSLPDFPLDASLGSHFFHNVTSMGVGYFSVNHDSATDRIDWDAIAGHKLVEDGNFARHIHFECGLEILMDGKKRRSLIRHTPCGETSSNIKQNDNS